MGTSRRSTSSSGGSSRRHARQAGGQVALRQPVRHPKRQGPRRNCWSDAFPFGSNPVGGAPKLSPRVEHRVRASPPGRAGFLPQGIRRCRHAELGELEVSLVGSCHRGTGSLPGGLWWITRSSAGDPRRSERCHLRQRVAPFWGCRTSASPAGVARNWWTWRQEGHIRQLSWQKLSLFLVDVPHRQSRPLVLRPSLYRVPRLGPRTSWLCAAGFEKLGPRGSFSAGVWTQHAPKAVGPTMVRPQKPPPGRFAAFEPDPQVPRRLPPG